MNRLLILAILMAATVSVSCGTARIDLKTNVLSSGEVDQEVVIRGDGAIGEALKDSFRPEDSRKEGWSADLKSEGNSYVLRMAKRLKKGESLFPPGKSGSSIGGAGTDPKFDFTVTESLLEREYRLRVVLPPNGQAATTTPSAKTDYEKQMAQLGEQLVRSMFKMTWTINLPGEVVETNADGATKTGGTWEFGLDHIQEGREMILVSRERRNLTPFIGGGFVLLGLVGFGTFYLRGRHRVSVP